MRGMLRRNIGKMYERNSLRIREIKRGGAEEGDRKEKMPN